MKVKCINNIGKENNITTDKIYDVLDKIDLDDNSSDCCIYKILNDEGIEKWYVCYRFEMVEK